MINFNFLGLKPSNLKFSFSWKKYFCKIFFGNHLLFKKKFPWVSVQVLRQVYPIKVLSTLKMTERLKPVRTKIRNFLNIQYN